MNVWLLLLGIASIVAGIFVLRNRERVLHWSQKQLRQGAGQLGDLVAEGGKPSHMTVPGVGTILIGVSLVFQAVTQAPPAEATSSSSAGVAEGLDMGLVFLGIGFIAMGAHILLGRERALGWSQKRFRLNGGQLREVFSEEGKPRRMIGPAIGTVLVGVFLVFMAIAEASIA